MSNINERLIEVITDLGISKNQFAISIGTSSAMISKITKQKVNFGIDVLQKIISAFPHLNQQWLLTGIGDMWLKNHTEKPHLTTHLSGDNAQRKRTPAEQKFFDEMMAEHKEKYKEFEEFVANKDNVQYIYVRKIYDLLRDNHPELYNLRNNIDIVLGLKDVIFQFEENLFTSVERAFRYFPKGEFNFQSYESQVITALQNFNEYNVIFDKLVKAVIVFYSEMKALNTTDIDYDTYSLNRI